MWKLIRFLKGYRASTVAAPLFKLTEALFELIIPLVVARLVDVGIAGGNRAYVWKMGAVMLVLGAAGLAFSLTCQYLAARASMGYGANVRKALYEHINTLSYAELDTFGTPSLVTRLTNDVNQTQVGVAMFIRLVLRAPFIATGAIVMSILIDPTVSLIFIGMAVAVGCILWIVMTRSTPYYRKIQKKLDTVSLLTRENLSGARVVRAFSRQQEENDDFCAATDDLARTNVRVGLIAGLLNPLTYAVINLAVIAVLWLGGKKVHGGQLSQGEILALVNYLSQILLALVVTANLAVTFTKASACAGRINEVFALTPSITDGPGANVQTNAEKIRFENVSFGYGANARPMLKNISFSIVGGETVGIIGPTGSGKTTLVSLIPRFYDATKGNVFVCGDNVKNYKLSQLRQKIGVVPQVSHLFSGTVRENMLLGKRDATDEEIWRALRLAQAEEFIRSKPGGLDFVVSRGGKNFSGGQRQRLSIARALVTQPEILILDDASSALDYATDAALRLSLREYVQGGMTAVYISQRAVSLCHCTTIIVLEDGAVVGMGTHEQLLTDCPVYREIYLSQVSEREAKAI